MLATTTGRVPSPLALVLPSFIQFFLVPPLLTLLALRYAHPSHSYLTSLPTSLIILLSLASIPAHLYATLAYQELRDTAARRSLGVAKVPVVRGWLPGNIDVLLNLWGGKDKRPTFLGTRDTNFSKEYGTTYNLYILWKDFYYTTDPSNIKTVLSTSFPSFEKGIMFKTAFRSFLGEGIFNSDGETWKMHRAMSRPFFAKEKISDFDHFDRHSESLVNVFRSHSSRDEPFDIQDLFGRFTLDTAIDFLFGHHIDTLVAPPPTPPSTSSDLPSSSSSSSLPNSTTLLVPSTISPTADSTLPSTTTTETTERTTPALPFVTAFNEVQRIVTNRGRMGWIWPFFELWSGSKTDPHMEVINAFTLPILEKALEKKRSAEKDGRRPSSSATADLLPEGIDGEGGPGEGEEGESLLDVLLQKSEDLKFVQDELLNILLAARDTTSSLLTMTTYALSQHPTVLARLREEILSVVEESGKPDLGDLRQMKYLRAVLNETLRLYPVVPGNMRESVGGSILPCSDSGIPKYIPPRTPINYVAFNANRKEQHWGHDAKVFDPDRWLDERAKLQTANPFTFVPFNAGPRICIGQQFAYNEASYAVVRFLQAFDTISLARDAQPKNTLPPRSKDEGWPDEVWFLAEITLFVKGGLWVRVSKSDKH